MRMKVLMLTTSFPKRSGESSGLFVLRLAEALSEKGVEVRVVAPSEKGLPFRERMGRVEVVRFSYSLPRWQTLAYGGGIPENVRGSVGARLQIPSFFFSFLFRALLESGDCDLVHAHWTFSGLVGLAVGKLQGLPLVLSVRGSDVHLGWRPLRSLNRFVLPRAQALTAVSASVCRALEGMGHRARMVPNGVELPPGLPLSPAAARRALGLPPRPFTLLFLGRLAEVKDPLFLIDVFRRLLDTGSDARLLVVGGGALEGRLKERTADIRERIRFAGKIPAGEAARWVEACDALVLTSRSEGRPNAVLEAMARSRPVVAANVGGTGELVRDGESGLLVPPGRPDLFVEALRRLERDPALRRKMGRKGRRLLSEWALTWEGTARKTLDVYRSLLDR